MPIYFAWFITALLSVGGDANDQNLPQSGRLLYCVIIPVPDTSLEKRFVSDVKFTREIPAQNPASAGRSGCVYRSLRSLVVCTRNELCSWDCRQVDRAVPRLQSQSIGAAGWNER